MQEQFYYSEVDEMPLHNWLKCQEGKLQYCRREWSVAPVGVPDKDAWEILQNDYLKKIGPGDTQKKYLKLLDTETTEIANYLETEERFKLNRIRHLRIEINKLLDLPEDTTLAEVLVILGKWYGGKPLRAKEITVLEFETIQQLYVKENRKG
jgi:hypothetical protein